MGGLRPSHTPPEFLGGLRPPKPSQRRLRREKCKLNFSVIFSTTSGIWEVEKCKLVFFGPCFNFFSWCYLMLFDFAWFYMILPRMAFCNPEAVPTKAVNYPTPIPRMTV